MRAAVKHGERVVAVSAEDGQLFILTPILDDKNVFHVSKRVKNHSDRVWDVKFSLTNKYLATSSDDKTVILRHGSHFAPIKIITHHDVTKELSFSYDETKLATSCWDMSAYIWSIPSCEPIVQLKDHFLYVQSALFLPDGFTVVTTSADKTVGVWDLREGGRIAKMVGHKDWIDCQAVRDDGLRLLTGSRENRVRLWDLTNFECISEIVTPSAPTAVAFSLENDGYIISCGAKTYFVDLNGMPLMEFENLGDICTGIAF